MKRRICLIVDKPSASLSHDAAAAACAALCLSGRGLRDQDRGPGGLHQGAGLSSRGQGEVRLALAIINVGGWAPIHSNVKMETRA